MPTSAPSCQYSPSMPPVTTLSGWGRRFAAPLAASTRATPLDSATYTAPSGRPGEVALAATAVHRDDLGLRDAADEEAPRRAVPGDAFGDQLRIVQAKAPRRGCGLRLLGGEPAAQRLEVGVAPQGVEADAFHRHDAQVAAEQHAQGAERRVALAELRLHHRLVVGEHAVMRPLDAQRQDALEARARLPGVIGLRLSRPPKGPAPRRRRACRG